MNKREIEKTYKMIKEYHSKYLAKHGVKLPALKKKSGYTKDALTLVYLAYGYPNTKVVTKDELTVFIRKHGGSNDVQQARHLGKQRGWYIDAGRRNNSAALLSGEYKLISLENPFPGYFPKRRHVAITEEMWEDIKRQYGYRCACCGSKEGEPNFYSPSSITKLQKGHMDPSKELTVDNIIPQCSLCNQPDKNFWIYDSKGRVVAVADPIVIEKSTEDVQKAIYGRLKMKYEKTEEKTYE